MPSFIPAPRPLNILAFLACLAAMAGALYLQHVDGLEPCPLCIFQRVGVIAAAVILLIASLHGPVQDAQGTPANSVALLLVCVTGRAALLHRAKGPPDLGRAGPSPHAQVGVG